jgi:hypothetical protein
MRCLEIICLVRQSGAFQEVLREVHEKLLKLQISRMLRKALRADLDVHTQPVFLIFHLSYSVAHI